jgi:hypothetical protein
MKTRSKIIVTSVVTLVLFGIAAGWSVFAAGIGHGSYIPALALFPYSTMLMAYLAQYEALYDLEVWLIPTLMFSQFCIYGFFIGRAWVRGRTRKTVFILGSIHGAVLLVIAVAWWVIDYARQ